MQHALFVLMAKECEIEEDIVSLALHPKMHDICCDSWNQWEIDTA